MRQKIKPLVLMAFLVLGLCVISIPNKTLAATNEIYLSPASTSVQNGNDITVSLRINPSSPVNTVQANINFDPSALQATTSTADVSSSAFPTCVTNSISGGTISLSCGLLGGGTVSSDSLIANITFKALIGSGTTTLQLSNVNAAGSGSYTNPSSANSTISFTSPPVTNSNSSSSGSTTPSSSGSSTSTKSSNKTTSTPTSTAIAPTSTPTVSTPSVKVSLTATVNKASYNQVTLNTSSNVPVSVYIKYGTSSTDLNLQTSPTASSKDDTVSLDPSQIIPGTTYFYSVVSTDANGNVQQSPIQTFTTKGYTVYVTVLDSNYHPLSNKIVTLHSTTTTATTNSQGVATFTNVAPGLHHVDYSVSGSKTYSEPVYVNNTVSTSINAATIPQTAAVILTNYKAPSNSYPSGLLIAQLIIILAIAVLFLFVIDKPLSNKIRSHLLSSHKNRNTKPSFTSHYSTIHPTQY